MEVGQTLAALFKPLFQKIDLCLFLLARFVGEIEHALQQRLKFVLIKDLVSYVMHYQIIKLLGANIRTAHNAAAMQIKDDG